MKTKTLFIILLVLFIVIIVGSCYQTIVEDRVEEQRSAQLKSNRPIFNDRELSVCEQQNEYIIDYLEEIMRQIKRAKSQQRRLNYLTYANTGAIAAISGRR
jgi:uncharacterized protein YpmS